MSSFTVQVSGADGIRRVLRNWLEPELDRRLDAATKKSAQLLAREVRKEARPVSKHMARAIRVKRARRDRPGWVVGSRRKTPPGAFFFHMVIGGTRGHGPRRAKALVFIPNFNPYVGGSSHGIDTGRVVRTGHVRGVPPNPIVERAARRAESQAMTEADRYLGKNT